MDEDVVGISREELLAEVRKLRGGREFLRGCLKYRPSLDEPSALFARAATRATA